MKVFLKILLLVSVFIVIIGCRSFHIRAEAASRTQQAQVKFALGTICSINLFEGGNSWLYSRIFSRIQEIDRTMTAFENKFQDLDGIAAINRQAGIEPVKIHSDLFYVLERALYFAELSNGAFDPTVGALTRLWGIGTDMQRIPNNYEIATALELVDWRNLIIDREEKTAFLRYKGMAIDLGGIGYGFAGDEAARIARENGVTRGIIDIGGDIVLLGWREMGGAENLPWRIGIQNPLGERGSFIGILLAHDKSIATSGVYEHFYEHEGRRYHHLFSTLDGFPVDNGLLSVTVVASSSIEADALSTVAFTMGFECGKALINSIPGAEAIFVFDNYRVSITNGLADVFTLTSSEFTLK